MTSSNGFAETRESLGDDLALRDLTLRINQLQQELENLKNEFAKWIKEL